MADQDAQDINQMMSATPEGVIAAPRKSRFLWVVLGCVILGVGLGIVVYQQSIKPAPKTVTTPKPTVLTAKPSPIAPPVTPEISVVDAEAKTVSFPKAGEIRVYYEVGGWLPLGMILTDPAGVHEFAYAAGTPTTRMKILDTGYRLAGPTTVSIDTFLGTDKTKLSVGWAKPGANKCGFNGFTAVDITPNITFATAEAKGEPLVSIQCWGDYSPNPADPSSKDFNDYTLIWSYTPSSTAASASPSSAASSSPVASVAASPSPVASVRASAIASATPTPTPTTTSTSTPTPVASPRVVMPDTSEGTPVTGIFEVTVGAISIGLILLIIGLFGLLAL